MTTKINRRFSSLPSFISTSNNAANFSNNTFGKFAKNQLSNSAQKALKGGDGDDDIIIEDTIGG